MHHSAAQAPAPLPGFCSAVGMENSVSSVNVPRSSRNILPSTAPEAPLQETQDAAREPTREAQDSMAIAAAIPAIPTAPAPSLPLPTTPASAVRPRSWGRSEQRSLWDRHADLVSAARHLEAAGTLG